MIIKKAISLPKTVLSGSILGLLLGLAAVLPLSAQQSPQYLASNIPLDVDAIYEAITPIDEYTPITRAVLSQLVRNHYSEVQVNDDFSSLMLDRYIERLDPSRIYFTQADIDEFEEYRFELDDMLRAGDVNAGFEMYNRYRQRVIERMVYSLRRIEEDETPFDFTVEESLIIDRSEEPWPTSLAELEDLWRKRVKSNVLNAVLADEETSMEEIRADLSERYRSQLSQLLKNDQREVFQSYMDTMTMVVDPHTQYYLPQAAENFNMNMSLQLQGIGAVLTTENEYTEVVSIVTGGPADLAGELQPNDRITAVAQGDGDFVDVIGWRVDDVVQLIRGEKGSVVRLNVIPSSAENDFEQRIISITRDTVQLENQSAKSEIIEVERDGEIFNIGVIELPTFYIDFAAYQNRDPNYRSTTRDVRNLLEELKEQNVDGVVVDLRNNGGGSLSEANSLVGLFIDRGPTVQVMDAENNNIVQGDSDPGMVYDGPLAVLVNRLSASASEIFAGAIQDYQRGVVLGSQTFGKGTVQELIPMGSGQLKITRAKFYRISGESTQFRGVLPDVDFPDIYDVSEEIGEEALDSALPWDTIETTSFYRPFADLQPLLPTLVSRHEQRLQGDPDFIYINAQIQKALENRADNTLSLNRETLLAERAENDAWRLRTLNARRTAKGEEPYASVEEMDNSDEVEDVTAINTPGLDEVAEDEDEELDPYLRESGNVLVDMIELQRSNVFTFAAE
ncbi:MAG: tail-specific protease [Gammaproteobacteria bacterium]|nr:tail-specific protease [Gammaproteobacteria bacterium]|tara:strand:+ start:16644 stop:18845 length:2202 start_codon:yes stop_codon:yes gene_type:complete